MQTLIDGASVLNWVFLNGAGQVKEWAEEIINQVGFYGNKVRNLDREKDSAWYEAYLDLQQSTVNFITGHASNICDWTGKSDGAEEFFNSIAENVMAGDFNVSGPAGAAASSSAP